MRDAETSAVRWSDLGCCATENCKVNGASRILFICFFIILEREISYKILCLFSTRLYSKMLNIAAVHLEDPLFISQHAGF